jgi:hypothetical protein
VERRNARLTEEKLRVALAQSLDDKEEALSKRQDAPRKGSYLEGHLQGQETNSNWKKDTTAAQSETDQYIELIVQYQVEIARLRMQPHNSGMHDESRAQEISRTYPEVAQPETSMKEGRDQKTSAPATVTLLESDSEGTDDGDDDLLGHPKVLELMTNVVNVDDPLA